MISIKPYVIFKTLHSPFLFLEISFLFLEIRKTFREKMAKFLEISPFGKIIWCIFKTKRILLFDKFFKKKIIVLSFLKKKEKKHKFFFEVENEQFGIFWKKKFEKGKHWKRFGEFFHWFLADLKNIFLTWKIRVNNKFFI